MRARAALAASAALLSLALGLAGPAAWAANQAIVQVSASTGPGASPPGTSGSITLAIKNAGDVTANNLQAELTAVDAGLDVQPRTLVALGGLGAGESTVAAPFTFWVPSTAAAGFYHATVSLTYSYTVAGTTTYGSASVTATVTVRSPTTLAVTAFSPDRIQPGDRAGANVTFANLGSSLLSNVDVVWASPGSAILPADRSTRFAIATIPAHGNATLAFPIAASPTSPRGLNLVTLQAAYNDPTGARLAANFTVGILVGGATSFQVSLDRANGPTVTLSVANVGLNAAASVVVTPLPGDVPLLDGPLFLGDLAAGQEKPAQFHLASGAPPAPGATLRLGLEYTDPTGERATVEARVPFVPVAGGDVAANVQEVDGSTVTVAVTAVGLAPVAGVQVQLLPGDGFRIVGPDTVALGNLKPGEFRTADFEVHRTGASAATVPSARVAYTDSLGARQEADQPLDLAAVTADLGPPVWLVAAATAAALLAAEGLVALGVAAARRRRAREQAAEEAEERREAGRPPPGA